MVNEEESTVMEKHIFEEELLQTLKEMAKDKIPTPNGWHINFFLHFFNLMGHELVKVVEVVRCFVHIPSEINSTFLTLIPKESNYLSL